jgi:pantoate--beta-alanine ligase
MVSSDLPSAAERLSLGRGLLEADSVDYLTIVDAQTLQPLQRIDRPGRALVAARIRGTRLIDNMALN